MLILKSKIRVTAWGGNVLESYLQIKYEKAGQILSLYPFEESSNLILNGRYKGKAFNYYFNENKSKFGLERFKYFPLTISLIGASDNLSVQVHPDDFAVNFLEDGKFSKKDEAWYFIEAPQDQCVFCGCRCKSLDELRENLSNSSFMKCLNKVDINKGDYLYIEAGTIHLLTTGALVYEVANNCSPTYRLYDFERNINQSDTRELHIDKAIFSTRLEKFGKYVKSGNLKYVEEENFYFWHIDDVKNYRNKSNTLQIMTVISGNINVNEFVVPRGSSIVLEPGERIINKCQAEAIVIQYKTARDST